MLGGGAAAALGTATSGFTYATEYYLCEKQLIKVWLLLGTYSCKLLPMGCYAGSNQMQSCVWWLL